MTIPLAHLLRPQKLTDVIGQRHLIGPNKILTKLIETDSITNLILFGPPGTGKSCVANVIAKETKAQFGRFNATTISINDVRKFVKTDGRKLLFIDECYRLNRGQSDVLLPFVEDGTITFVGASTESPFHTLSAPLISRCQILQFEPLTERNLAELLSRGVNYCREHGRPKLRLEKAAAMHVIRVSCGDGRKCLTLLETVLLLHEEETITEEMVKNVSPNKYMVFGKDAHFDYASAYQGSIQASNPDAAIYWLAKWLESGEDPRYIARRLLVSASEDCTSSPLVAAVAQNAYIAAKEVGRPECDLVLAHATVLAASAPRDKSAACAIWSALKDVREGKEVWVPKEMKDSHYIGAKELGQGQYHDGMNMKAYVGIEKRYYFPEKWIKKT